MDKPLIVITGKSGQLGWELERLHVHHTDQFDFLFATRTDLDLSNPSSIPSFFNQHQPSFFINCAAYTAVDKAETDNDTAYTVNAIAVGELAKQCAAINCKFITISTDYVFDGKKNKPYITTDATDPLGQYGYTKLMGEQLAIENNPSSIIIRTSWVYSSYGNNFVKTMLRLMKEREMIKVVNDQIGSPTYAKDLAVAIIKMILKIQNSKFQITNNIYHFSNNGIISWYNFADAIQGLSGLSCKVLAIPSSEYPTPAPRPSYTAMDKQQIVNDFGIELIDWQKSLQTCMQELGYL